MTPFRSVRGRMAPLDRDNVDTDQIIPKQFLKRIERSGFGPFAFYDWSREGGFVLDRPEYRGAEILLTGANFGCGSSREHAPWALQDRGYRAIVAPSFADIFRNNCHKIGLLPVVLPEGRVRQLIDMATEDPSIEIEVDLESQTVRSPGFEAAFEVDGFARLCLLNGWDDIGLTLRHEDEITAFESRRPAFFPVVGLESKPDA